MISDTRIVLRAWFRIVESDHWSYVHRSEPLQVHSPKDHFMMDAFYDPGPVGDLEYKPTVVFRGYLLDDPAKEVLDILRGGRLSFHGSLEASENGLGIFPAQYANYVRQKAREIGRLSSDAYRLLLWRFRIISGPPDLELNPTSLFWAELPPETAKLTVGDLNWRQVPAGTIWLGLPDIGHLDLRPAVGETLTELLEEGLKSPLGHELLWEARRIRESNWRSALVMGVAAVETSVKEFITQVEPQTAWLLQNMQSPPLHKILKDYLPTLKSAAAGYEKVPSLPKEWRSTFNNAVELRNKIVHGRSVGADDKLIEDLLRTAYELLYFLDYHGGHEWAKA
jgi:hypothetical protein